MTINYRHSSSRITYKKIHKVLNLKEKVKTDMLQQSQSQVSCNHITRALNVVPTLVSQGSSFYLKYLVNNSKNLAFRVMHDDHVLQLHLIMMSKYFKFGVDAFSTFWVMGYIKSLYTTTTTTI